MNAENEDSTYQEEDPEELLDRLFRDAELKGQKLADKGRMTTRAGQNIEDLARVTRIASNYYLPSNYLEELIDYWSITNLELDRALSSFDYEIEPVISSASGTAAYSSTDFYNPDEVIPTLNPLNQADAYVALTNLVEVSTRIGDKDEVVRLIIVLGLNQGSPGSKSCLDQFTLAHSAFEMPVENTNPISTSLLPMRESIKLAIDYLLQRRPKQDKTRSEWNKIISIGSQLKYDTIPDAKVRVWAVQWNNLLNKYLSPSKKQDISRDDWWVRLNQSTLFLKGFLGGINPNRFK
jgi:hypothetical protein